MFEGQKLQNPWEFRKQADVDSSDDEYKSASSAEPVFKKIKQMSDLMSIKYKQDGSRKNSHSLERKRVKKGNKGLTLKIVRKGDSSPNKMNQRPLPGGDLKNERGRYGPATINSNLLYMQSILEELRVGRENMIVWMRGEIQKLMDDSVREFTTEEDKSESKRIKFKHHGRVESTVKMAMPSVSVEQSKGNAGIILKEFGCSANLSPTQVPTSSAYLTLPVVLPKKEFGSG